MNTDEKNDRLVDMLLWELVGEETPPDVRKKVLEAAAKHRKFTPVVSRKPVLRALGRPQFKRSKAPMFAIAAILTLLGIAGVLFQLQRISTAHTPVLASVSGTVNRAAGAISPGEMLVTGADSSAKIIYQDGTTVELSPETTIMVTRLSYWDRSKAIEVIKGSIQADVSRQAAGKPFALTAGDARAVVVGTKLSFGTVDDRTRLEVTEGAVRYTSLITGREALVKTGFFAESGKSGFRHEKIPVPGIIGFTLMNAKTDQPIRDEPLVNGEKISLSSLPTKKINIRADYEGEAPFKVRTILTRRDGRATGLPSHSSEPHEHPPFFVAGDHWAEGRPDDCQAWTPRPGVYQLSAEAFYPEDSGIDSPKPLNIQFRITE